MRQLCFTLALVGSACVTTSAPSRAIGIAGHHREPELLLVTHRVEKGQTLYRIARTYSISVDELMKANDLDDPRELKVGELLSIPGAKETHAVTTFDSPEPEPAPRSATAATVRDEPRPAQRKAVKVGREDGVLEWPLRGVLYARFGKKGKEPHDGIDLAAPAGTSVKTAGPGTVLFSGEQKGYGLIAIVEHEEGLITLYAHNRDLRVKTGQKVRAGQVVATVGDSGHTSGPHLHFEVRKSGRPVDPLEFLGRVPSLN